MSVRGIKTGVVVVVGMVALEAATMAVETPCASTQPATSPAMAGEHAVGRSADDLETRVFPLKNAAGDQVAPIVRAVLDRTCPHSRVAADAAGKSLAITASKRELDRMPYFLAQLDRAKPTPATRSSKQNVRAMNVRLFELAQASPKLVAEVMMDLYFHSPRIPEGVSPEEYIQESIVAQPANPGKQPHKLLLMYGRPTEEEIKVLVEQLDTAKPADVGVIKVYAVRNGKPQALERRLRKAISRDSDIEIVGYDATSSLIIEGEASQVGAAVKVLSQLDVPAGR